MASHIARRSRISPSSVSSFRSTFPARPSSLAPRSKNVKSPSAVGGLFSLGPTSMSSYLPSNVSSTLFARTSRHFSTKTPGSTSGVGILAWYSRMLGTFSKSISHLL
ncbi:hypothetical protein TL16_g12452 [Triparma laevis f. inornata]|uniref:Uncharacterized protein n=1 Tax=Triparma laevis f. inornata TaxID=1714386 RepID=A0A9W7EWV8_9STRA|nr:hypothetical protein TL16_g12452 [Triparma laevis f. inornata]